MKIKIANQLKTFLGVNSDSFTSSSSFASSPLANTPSRATTDRGSYACNVLHVLWYVCVHRWMCWKADFYVFLPLHFFYLLYHLWLLYSIYCKLPILQSMTLLRELLVHCSVQYLAWYTLKWIRDAFHLPLCLLHVHTYSICS